jgi:hypothetical protein
MDESKRRSVNDAIEAHLNLKGALSTTIRVVLDYGGAE